MTLLRLSSEDARRIMTMVWLGFFLVNLTMVFYLHFGDWIEQDTFKASIHQINASYVPYLGVISGYYLSGRKRLSGNGGKAGMPFALALVSSLTWNGVVFLFIFRVVMLWGTIEDSVKAIADVGSILSWLVAPAIGFYFANALVPTK